eukprot:Opistho-1_new@2790
MSRLPFVVAALVLALASSVCALPLDRDSYLQERAELLRAEEMMRSYNAVSLSDREQQANDVLMALKRDELAYYEPRDDFPPSVHFFQARESIEASAVFKVIRQMPKGGLLHVHADSMVDPTWVVATATYMEGCSICRLNGSVFFRFFPDKTVKDPTDRSAPMECKWSSVAEERAAAASVAEYDDYLRRSLTLVTEKPDEAYPTQSVVWERFDGAIIGADGLINYRPFFEMYYAKALGDLAEDNVQYVELRTVLASVYEADGTLYDRATVLGFLEKAVAAAVAASNGRLAGGKAIFCGIRAMDADVVAAQMDAAIDLAIQYPKFFAGFDLVGHEDPGHALVYFLDTFIESAKKQEAAGIRLSYFWHAGETNWDEAAVDDNLIDAVMLNTSRIGHGFALAHHPLVQDIVVDRQIAIEICPISNQVLKLVPDLRSHPAALYLDRGVPVTISSDDPALFGSVGLSYDFYEAFMGFGGGRLDMRALKTMAMNSVIHSAMSSGERAAALADFTARWAEFVDWVIASKP